MATGTATLDFGAFPGASHATVAVTGQTSIASGSLVEAWIRPVATSDHSADEHMVETLKVFAADIVAGTGFTIHGFNTSQLNEPVVEAALRGRFSGTGQNPGRGQIGPGEDASPVGGGAGTRVYGQWTVAWVWV